MTIEYDAELKRATHIESGLAVEFVREGPYAQERETFFNLIYQNRTISFRGDYDFGAGKILAKFPNIPQEEFGKKKALLNEKNFFASGFDVDIKTIIQSSPAFPKLFLEVWLRVVSEIYYWRRCSVHLEPYFNRADGEWSMEADAPLRPMKSEEGTKK